MIDYKKFEVESKASLYDCGNRLRRRNMMALLPDVRGKIVIEFGFGIGDFRMELRKRIRSTYKEYVGVDISLLNLRAAKHIEDSLKLNDEKNAMIQADVFRLPFNDGSADIVICAEILEHLDDAAALREISRVLKRGGYALITVPYLGEPVSAWGHLRHYDLKGLRKLCESSGLFLKKTRIFGRFHEASWVRIKHVMYRVWSLLRIFSRSSRSYYESVFHRYFVMPVFDKILFLDDMFRSPASVLGNKGYLVALIQK